MNQRTLNESEYKMIRNYLIGPETVVVPRVLEDKEISAISNHVANDHEQDYPNHGSSEYTRILFAHYHAAMRDELNIEDLKNRPTQTKSA